MLPFKLRDNPDDAPASNASSALRAEFAQKALDSAAARAMVR